MTTPFLGEIQLFGFNFAPFRWAQCSGQLMPISQNTALFSLLGTNFGGNGQSNFALPNFQGNVPCSQGQAPGLSPRDVGEIFGTTTVSLNSQEMAAHNHNMHIFGQPDATKRHGIPLSGDAVLIPGHDGPFTTSATSNTTFPAAMTGPGGGSGLPHENQQPYLAVNFCIALAGIFPARS
ncbi:phage tail protein [Dyella subtropica]|uniref:phage tail protein n=1 Tax=Dyella subtropica TaxID=2992127 RepID=UPI002253ECAF|nr:tail fiber protein [Dyella subtropica]